MAEKAVYGDEACALCDLIHNPEEACPPHVEVQLELDFGEEEEGRKIFLRAMSLALGN